MSRIYFYLFILSLTVQYSCTNLKCNNTNPIFDKYPAESEEYKSELLEVMKADNNLKYYLDSYDEMNGNNYLNISVQGDNTCAKAVIWIRNTDKKLDGIIKNKGMGYSGSELKGLQIQTAPDTKKIQFVYKGMDKVID